MSSDSESTQNGEDEAVKHQSTRRRVKLYVLSSEHQWDDKGTGNVTASYSVKLKGISLVVRSEKDNSLLLENRIFRNKIYNKQQETLIVWSEEDKCDIALSFQEKAGCDEIWEKICAAQDRDPSSNSTLESDVSTLSDDDFSYDPEVLPNMEIPPCELIYLQPINDLILSCLNKFSLKVRFIDAVLRENYIQNLCNLFRMCENIGDQPNLYFLFNIMKNLFLFNDSQLLNLMFAANTIIDVIGCLEYDPLEPSPKLHRQFLLKNSKFCAPIRIKNPCLLEKIRQTHRVQYIYDFVLNDPALQDAVSTSFTALISSNKREIVEMIMEDRSKLEDVVHLIADFETPLEKHLNALLFLKEFLEYAQNLEPNCKESVYSILMTYDILPALELIIGIGNCQSRSVAVGILTKIAEYTPESIRSFVVIKYEQEGEVGCFMNVLISKVLEDSKTTQPGELMKIIYNLLNPDSMQKQSSFLNFFYLHSFPTLIEPILANTLTNKLSNDDLPTVQQSCVILEFLMFCVDQHGFFPRNWIITNHLTSRILVLMNSKHKCLALFALRFLRKIIATKHNQFVNHIVEDNLFAPVLDAFLRNEGRNNLLDSAIIELFDFIKFHEMEVLCTYSVEKFDSIFKQNPRLPKSNEIKGWTRRNQKDFEEEEEKENPLDTTQFSFSDDISSTSDQRPDQPVIPSEDKVWCDKDQIDLKIHFDDTEMDTELDAMTTESSAAIALHDQDDFQPLPNTFRCLQFEASTETDISEDQPRSSTQKELPLGGEMEENKLNESQENKIFADASDTLEGKTLIKISLKPLVDYDFNDSDDEHESEESQNEPEGKKVRLN